MLQIISYGSADSISSLLLTDKKYVTIQNLHSENQSWARVFLITNRVLAYPIIVEGFLSKMFEMTAEYSDGHSGIRPNIRSFLDIRPPAIISGILPEAGYKKGRIIWPDISCFSWRLKLSTSGMQFLAKSLKFLAKCLKFLAKSFKFLAKR